MKKHFYGGQAVIEGVMIRGQKNCVVAVRNPEKNIVIKQIKIPSFSKALYKKIPFIRGVIILLEMMVIGYRSLTKSSEIVEENQNLNISTIEKLFSNFKFTDKGFKPTLFKRSNLSKIQILNVFENQHMLSNPFSNIISTLYLYYTTGEMECR